MQLNQIAVHAAQWTVTALLMGHQRRHSMAPERKGEKEERAKLREKERKGWMKAGM